MFKTSEKNKCQRKRKKIMQDTLSENIFLGTFILRNIFYYYYKKKKNKN